MGTMIQTRYGMVQGVEGKYCYQFRSIPYAKPPVGQLRFHAPLKSDRWQGILDATKYRARAYQNPNNQGGMYGKEFNQGEENNVPMSEDCLHLNVWMPKTALTGEEKYPVAIWFHGGGFFGGYSFEMEFGGEEYAKRGVILVTANYRLGLFGYLAHPKLRERDGHSGNYALLDQLAAIDWVRENIDSFGGDRENITIFGQSAGGYSVRCLVSSPLAKGKFQKAIIQSCGGYGYGIVKNILPEQLERLSVGYLKKHGLDFDDLMNIPAEKLADISNKYMLWGMLHGRRAFTMVPETDGYVITGDSDTMVDREETFEIPYMIGCTRDDVFVSRAGKKDRNKNKLYTSSVDWCIKHNERNIPSYAYYFSHDLPGDKHGAFHSAELWYMFGTLSRCWRPFTDGDWKLSERMVDAWTLFMKTGNPGWDCCTKANQYVEEFR